MYRFLFASLSLCLLTAPVFAQEATEQAKPAAEKAASGDKPNAQSAPPAAEPQKTKEPAGQKKAPAKEEKPKDKPAESKPAEDKKDDKPAAAEKKKKEVPGETKTKKDAGNEKQAASKPEMKKDAPAEKDKKPEPKETVKDKKKEETKQKRPARIQMPSIGYSDTPQLPGQPWRVHDVLRPRPPVVSPGKNGPSDPPSDAIVLFDGTDLSQWGHADRENPGGFVEPEWKIEDGCMVVGRGTGYLISLENFASCQLHIEWSAPAEVKGDGQGRGNSGIKFLGKYEVQILDSYNNRTYADGQAGSVYGQYPPKVNAMRPPGEWQAYDIIFEIAEFDSDGKLTKPAFLTVFHNGVLLHHRQELSGPTGRAHAKFSNHPPGGPIMIQDHGNPVRYRNIWARPL